MSRSRAASTRLYTGTLDRDAVVTALNRSAVDLIRLANEQRDEDRTQREEYGYNWIRMQNDQPDSDY